MQATTALNHPELRRYIERVDNRWRLDGAYLGEPGSAGELQALDDRASGFTVVLISDAFDEVPWLERVYVATSLWDALEMRAAARVHCYTRAEFERRRESAPAVHDAACYGVELLAMN